MYTSSNLLDRIARVVEMRRNDPNRFKVSRFGEGYLTRNERYYEVMKELWRRHDAIGIGCIKLEDLETRIWNRQQAA